MKELSTGDKTLIIYTQDDPGFPDGIPGVIHDTTLEQSYRFQIETVPTLISLENGREIGRSVGWDQAEWRALSEIKGLGEGLPWERGRPRPHVTLCLANLFDSLALWARSLGWVSSGH